MSAHSAKGTGPLSLWTGLAGAGFAAAIALFMLLAARSPERNWDMICYVGGVIALGESDPLVIHRESYADVRRFVEPADPGAWAALLKGQSRAGAYQEAVHHDPTAFAENMRFYTIRPLYIWATKALSLVTPTIAQATSLVSVVSYGLIGMVVLSFLLRHFPALTACFLATAIMVMPPMIQLARFSTPDAMGLLLFLPGVLWLLEGRCLAAAVILFVAVGVRTDIALFNLIAALGLLMFWSMDRRPRLLGAAAILLLSIGLVMLINRQAGSYGWATLYAHTFNGYLPYPSRWNGDITIARMIRVTVMALLRWWVNGPLCLLAIAMAVTVASARLASGFDRNFWFVFGALALYLAGRIILLPNLEMRLLTPYLVACCLLTAWNLRPRAPAADHAVGPPPHGGDAVLVSE